MRHTGTPFNGVVKCHTGFYINQTDVWELKNEQPLSRVRVPQIERSNAWSHTCPSLFLIKLNTPYK